MLPSRDVARRAQRKHAAVQHEQPVEPIVDAIEVVRGHEHRHAAGHESAHDFTQLFFGFRIDAGGRLVEQQQLRFLCDRARYENSLLLSAGEIRNRPIRQRLHPDGTQRLVNDLAILFAAALPKLQPRKASHRDDVPHGCREGPIHRFDLGHVRDRPRRQRPRLCAEHAKIAAGRLQQPCNGFQQRRFA